MNGKYFIVSPYLTSTATITNQTLTQTLRFKVTASASTNSEYTVHSQQSVVRYIGVQQRYGSTTSSNSGKAKQDPSHAAESRPEQAAEHSQQTATQTYGHGRPNPHPAYSVSLVSLCPIPNPHLASLSGSPHPVSCVCAVFACCGALCGAVLCCAVLCYAMLCYGALCEFFAGRWAKAGQVAAPVGSSFCFAFFCCNIHDV